MDALIHGFTKNPPTQMSPKTVRFMQNDRIHCEHNSIEECKYSKCLVGYSILSKT